IYHLVIWIGEKRVERLPCLRLGKHIGSHCALVGQQAEKAKLGETAKINERVALQRIAPYPHCFVMRMDFVTQREPDIHVREKVCTRRHPPRRASVSRD